MNEALPSIIAAILGVIVVVGFCILMYVGETNCNKACADLGYTRTFSADGCRCVDKDHNIKAP